jgi:antitoxin (DNA-binding transcriptional repressor) of toxin-antitoxin stability system
MDHTSLIRSGDALMRTVNIREAKTHLSRLVRQAAEGDSFVIAKAGRPLVQVTRFAVPAPRHPRRLGFMAGQIQVPDDFDRMGTAEIEETFGLAP